LLLFFINTFEKEAFLVLLAVSPKTRRSCLGHHGGMLSVGKQNRKDLFKEINDRSLTPNNIKLMDFTLKSTHV